MSERRFWAVGDRERINAENSDEAFEEHLEDCGDVQPEKMTAREFRPMKVDMPDPDDVLNNILEMLDEEHGDPDGDPYEATESMKSAAEILCRTVALEYVPWNCEPTGETVDVVTAEWLQKNETIT